MKYVHFQVKKRLSFEVQKVAIGLSAHPPLSATSARLGRQKNLASASRLRAKREISALSAIVVFSKAQCTTDALSSNPLTRAKRKGGAKRNVANSEPI